jgi:hypothetical protein
MGEKIKMKNAIAKCKIKECKFYGRRPYRNFALCILSFAFWHLEAS